MAMPATDTAATVIDIWQRLLEPEAARLLVEVSAHPDIRPKTIARLRREYPAELVAAAIELSAARRKASAKFPARGNLVADVTGVEQASSACAAAHKARRFAEARADRVIDLCCGIGGDAMALARGAEVVAVDRDPLRVWMTRENTDCRAVAADVSGLALKGRYFHLDPSRRENIGGRTNRRRYRYADYQPGPAYVDELMRRCPHGAVKLGPGVAFDALPAGEIEVIGEHGRLVQAVLWTGRLARAERSATRLPEGVTISGSPRPPEVSEYGRYLFAVDAAVERAGLTGLLAEQLGVASIHPELGLLTADEPIDSPWLVAFEVIQRMPWHQRKVREWLAAHDGGVVEVKTRGGAVDANAVQRQLRGDGSTPFTVFVLRMGRQVVTFVTRRVVHAGRLPR